MAGLSGSVAERFKAPVLKTGVPKRNRGFESHPLRHQRRKPLKLRASL